MEKPVTNSLHEFLFCRLDGMIPLKKGLDAFALRQKVIAANIANVETPEYRAKQVTFEEELSKVLNRQKSGLRRTHPDHIPVRGGVEALDRVKAEVIPDQSPALYNGVNNVDIDKEVAHMATNQIHYATVAKVIALRHKLLLNAIKGH